MNLSDKNIDQLFRDGAQNSNAPRYDHAYWNEIKATLNAEDKRKRGFILWSVAGSFVATLLVVSLFYINGEETKILLADSNDSSIEYTKNKDLKSNQGKLFSSSDNDTEKTNSNTPLEEKAKYISSSKSFEGTVVSGNVQKTSGSSVTNLTADSEFQEDNDYHSNEETNYTSSEIERLEEQQEIKSHFKQESELVINSLTIRKIELREVDVETSLVPFDLKDRNNLTFYTKLSAGLMENYETSRPFESGVFDLSLNTEFQKGQVLFRAGIGFQMTSNADLVVSERAKVYGFGLTTHQNNLSYQSLYDIYVPLEIGYSLNNTSFGFGAQLNYMIGTTMNYESMTNDIVVDKTKLKGFKEGLNSFTAQGFVWLEQKVSNRFVAGIKVGTNLNSRIKEGRYFNESSTTNPLYGQLTLRYNLNK
jgi:hypothetical protein